MKLPVVGLTVVIMTSLSGCIGTSRVQRAAFLPGPVHTAAPESGVVPPGTWLVVRTNDVVRTRQGYPDTVYYATVARDVVDQNKRVLIPKESAVELAVRWLPYLGPGGAGMTELMLGVDSVTVHGVRYPVATDIETPGAGGIGVYRQAAKLVNNEPADHVQTAGRRINVAADTLLAFRTEDPIRLRGYRR